MIRLLALTTAVMNFRSHLLFSRPPSLGLVALGVGVAVLVAGCSGVQPPLQFVHSNLFVTQKKEINVGLAIHESTRAFSTARTIGLCHPDAFFLPSPYGENFTNTLRDRLSQIYETVTDLTAAAREDSPTVILEAALTDIGYRFGCPVSPETYVKITASLRLTDRNGREVWRNRQGTFRQPATVWVSPDHRDQPTGENISNAIAAMVDGWAQELLQIPDQALGIEPPEQPVIAAAGTGEVRGKAAKNRDNVAKQHAVTSTPPAPDAALVRERFARIQRQLASLGYDTGPADGVLGPRTRAAIRAFEAREGLPVTGTISERLEAALRTASVNPFDQFDTPATRSIEKASTGSGFYVSSQGHVLTNEHVVNGCVEVRIPPSLSVEIVVQDEANDLALLKSTSTKANAAAKFRGGRGIRPGDDIVVLGYPLRGLLASEANVTTGTVSALAGPGDDRRFIQITAPVQPGNSGGPVLDGSGHVVGVVVAQLDALKLVRRTGRLPQNVNFAISEGAARAFLDAHDVPYETAKSNRTTPTADIAAKAKGYTVLIECWK